MIAKMLWAALYACLLIPSALAQDPTKIEPKHYQLAFENEYVQVVNIHYGPHEKSALHNHPGSVVVVLTSGHLKFTDEKGKRQEIYAKPAECR
jgi:quercetin dioxygenase-like cupin family protein